MPNLNKSVGYTFLWIWCGFFLCSPCWGQERQNQANAYKRTQVKVLPLAYYTPETRLAFGGLLYFLFRTNPLDTVSRKSNIQQYVTFTINRQFIFENSWQIFNKNEKYVFSGELDYTRFPELFFGIGSHTKYTDKEYYSFDRLKLNSINLWQMGNKNFLGIQYNLQYVFNLDTDKTKMMRFDNIPGTKGYFISGFGPIYVKDTRDNILNTHKGNYLEVSYSIFDRWTGSQYSYQNMTIDVRKFIPIKTFTWAFQLYANTNVGELPFRALPALGGGRYLRGFYAGRYRDNHMLVFQTEFRGDVVWRLGFALFGGTGRVAQTYEEVGASGWKYSIGGGIRFKINRKENVNIRLDYGYTGESHGVYILFAEAF